MRDSFIFYGSFLEALEELPPEVQLQVYQAVTKYALKGVLPELTGIAKAIFALIKPQIDANNAKLDKYNQDIENGKKGAEYGKLGGRPKKENPPQKPPLNPPGVIFENPINANANVNVNANSNVEVVVVEEEKKEEEIVEIKKQKELGGFYGEYKNVHLTKHQYDVLYTCILNEVILKELIEELSEAIVRGKNNCKPYDEKNPNKHFADLKAFWRFRREHPEKYLHKDTDSGGSEKSKIRMQLEEYFANKKECKT